MTDIIVEDGSGVEGANSYVTVSGVDSYASMYGYDTWTASTQTVKEQSLLKAMRYIDGQDWRGQRVVAEQPLAFPRENLYEDGGREVANDIVPNRVIEAVCEAAYLMLPDSGVDLDQVITKDDYTTAEQVAGGVSVAYKYLTDDNIRTVSTIIEAKLKGFLRNKLIIEIIRA